MADAVSFASHDWFLTFGLLLFARGMDFLSTWIATPNMVLEGNPIAKWLGWKGGVPFNLALSFVVAFWPGPALIISTTSILVAARNFQLAWLMRSMGESAYRDWFIERLRETPLSLYLFCLIANSSLTALVGIGVAYYGQFSFVLAAIGIGIIGYAIAVLFYTLLATWRIRRSWRNP